MTANAERRRRFTIVGAILAVIGVIAVISVSVVAVATLRTSQEGRAPETEQRDVVSFPETPNAVIGVVDDLDRLSSLAILTLDPSGVGGSIVVVPVNVDQTNGFGPLRLPVSRQPYTPGDVDQAAELITELEPLLTLTIERSNIVGPDQLADLLAPFGEFDVDLPERVVDSDTPGSGMVVRSGTSTLDIDTMTEAFTAINATGESYDHHPIDVALWSAVAEAASVTAAEPPLDGFDRPIAPASFDELWDRLFAGEVGVHDLAIDEFGARSVDNESDADFVLASRPDSLLVFGSISPGLVSTPNESVSLMIVVGFDEDDVAALGETADGTPISKASMTRRFIGELIFKQANIVAVDLAETPGAVPETTQLFVSSERIEEQVRAVSERFFGDAEVIVAERLTDGVDVVVVLGENFLVQRAELLDVERAAADDAETRPATRTRPTSTCPATAPLPTPNPTSMVTMSRSTPRFRTHPAIPSSMMADTGTQMASDAPIDDDGESLALVIARAADDKKGDDIIILDVGDVLAIAGWFVIVSASNSRLVESLANDVEAAAKAELGRSPVRMEGHREKQWVLIDYGDVVVHVFHKEMRDFYEIERLYGDVPRLKWN